MDDDLDEVLTDLEKELDGSSSDEVPPGQSLLRPMVLGLIQSSYLRTHTFSEFARDVYDIVTLAASVPVAFADGFLRSLLSIESVHEDASGRVTIRPKPGADEHDLVRDVDELTARIDPSAVYNPVVRQRMDRVAEASHRVMQQDLQALAELSADELQSALHALEQTEMSLPEEEPALDATEYLRRRLAGVRKAVRDYQAGLGTTGDDTPTAP
jgi:hypothetical protein